MFCFGLRNTAPSIQFNAEQRFQLQRQFGEVLDAQNVGGLFAAQKQGAFPIIVLRWQFLKTELLSEGSQLLKRFLRASEAHIDKARLPWLITASFEILQNVQIGRPDFIEIGRIDVRELHWAAHRNPPTNFSNR